MFAFIQVADPTKVNVGERECAEGEARLLDSTVGHVVSLLPVAPARADSELEASVDRLFDEGGSIEQGDFAGGGGQEIETEIVMGVRGSSHPPKKIRGDHETFSWTATGGKSPFVLKELLASNILNVEVGVMTMATLPMVTSSVYATPEHEGGVPTDSITGLNLRTIGAFERFVIFLDSSHYSSINASRAEADSVIRFSIVPPMMTEAVVTSHAVNVPSVLKTGTKVTAVVHASMFHDSDSTKTVKADTASPFYSAKQDISMGSRQLNSKTLHQVFVPQWNVLNDSLLDDYDCWDRPSSLLKLKGMRIEYCLSERKRLESECEKQAALLKAKDDKVESLKAQLLLKETEAAEATRLRVQVTTVEATEKMHVDEIDALKQRNVVLENEKESLDGKVAELQSLVSTKDLELKDLNVVVSSLTSQKDSLVNQVHALKTTCFGLHDQVSGYEQLKEQIEEFQDAHMNIVNDKVAKLDADLLEMALHLKEKFYLHHLITISGRRGRRTDLQPRLREVEFPLLAELKSYKDESTVDVINLLRLEGPFVDAPGMSDFETTLSFALSVTQSQVERIRENVATQRSALIDVWVPLVDLLSAKSLIGESSTSGSVPTIVVTTAAMSTTFAAASSVPPIIIEDYEIAGTDGPKDGQGNGKGNIASFPTVEFEKEKLDTTLEHDPPS
uniref:Uncharacterized protein n=1 Tax=Tanacetum cinerariifolium TaxID=118510 RepID=A0A6L2NWP2_TANCI|nr:hypothetical protein [Tanacetum cinerariifolium]